MNFDNNFSTRFLHLYITIRFGILNNKNFGHLLLREIELIWNQDNITLRWY